MKCVDKEQCSNSKVQIKSIYIKNRANTNIYKNYKLDQAPWWSEHSLLTSYTCRTLFGVITKKEKAVNNSMINKGLISLKI